MAEPLGAKPRAEAIEEVARLMGICNACRYCEGHCAVFPEMERHTVFDERVVDTLAHLCHGCGACFHHCPYTAPHAFDMHVPKAMSAARQRSYEHYAWPGFMGVAFRHGLAFGLVALALCVLVTVVGIAALNGVSALFHAHPGGFYDLVAHGLMAGFFGSVSALIAPALIIPLARYWKAVHLPAPRSVPSAAYFGALKDALTLKNLDGGHGQGCYLPSERPSMARRYAHHLTMYGFALCFAATCTGAVYHYVLDWPAPYPWPSLPKLFGVTGGIALIIGVLGLAAVRTVTDPVMKTRDSGLGAALLVLLFVTAATGLALPALGATAFMGVTLALHLGSVLALFVCFAYGKFMHGLFRFIALLAARVRPEPAALDLVRLAETGSE